MTIQITAAGLRQIFPRAPQAVIDADWQAMLDKGKVSHTRPRLTYLFANVEHECGGFTIKNLTENINYSHVRAAQIWPGRFPGGAEQVRAKYGSAPGWQLKMFDDVYGNRMGNRPLSHDGSTFIGHGGPQWTGRDGHEALARYLSELLGLPRMTAEEAVRYAISYPAQPAVCVAFWMWKNLNAKADIGDFKGAVKLWNGGQIGMADRLAQMAGNDPIIKRLENAETIMPKAKEMPGVPPTPTAPPEVIDEATKRERATQKTGIGTAGVGAAGEATKAGTEVPPTPLLAPFVTYTLIGVGVAVVIVAVILIARKKAAVAANWF
ncbi:MAG TPA: hypothetical protein VIH40_13765 [Xanthobacteraceae bacterium]